MRPLRARAPTARAKRRAATRPYRLFAPKRRPRSREFERRRFRRRPSSSSYRASARRRRRRRARARGARAGRPPSPGKRHRRKRHAVGAVGVSNGDPDRHRDRDRVVGETVLRSFAVRRLGAVSVPAAAPRRRAETPRRRSASGDGRAARSRDRDTSARVILRFSSASDTAFFRPLGFETETSSDEPATARPSAWTRVRENPTADARRPSRSSSISSSRERTGCEVAAG